MTVTKTTVAATTVTKTKTTIEGRTQEDEGGEGHFRPEEAQRGAGCDLRREVVAAHGGYEEGLGVHQEEQPQRGPHHQAGCDAQGCAPGGVPGHAQDGWAHLEALVVSLASPRPFSRRVPTWCRAREWRPQELRSCNLARATH